MKKVIAKIEPAIEIIEIKDCAADFIYLSYLNGNFKLLAPTNDFQVEWTWIGFMDMGIRFSKNQPSYSSVETALVAKCHTDIYQFVTWVEATEFMAKTLKKE